MGKLQHFGQHWRHVNLSSNADKKINIWLPFEFERKEIGKDGSRSSCKNNPIRDPPAKGGGQHHLKSMYKCSKQLKK
jgi:hypothetical protein